MVHAQLDANGLCTGYGNLNEVETKPRLVYLPDGWSEDLLWRKWVNGAWSIEKFMPVVAPSGPDPDLELYNAINASTDFNSLKAALLGNGKLASVKGKMK